MEYPGKRIYSLISCLVTTLSQRECGEMIQFSKNLQLSFQQPQKSFPPLISQLKLCGKRASIQQRLLIQIN